MYRHLVTVLSFLALLGGSAAAAPHHPLSQIYPMDVDLNLSGQDINEIGDLRFEGGSSTFHGTVNMSGNEIVDYVTDASSAAPTTPEGGQMWFDAGQNVLKYYNGTRWVVMASANAVSSDLQSVLGAGNSAGTYNINMSDQSILDVHTVRATPGQLAALETGSGTNALTWRNNGNVHIPNGNLEVAQDDAKIEINDNGGSDNSFPSIEFSAASDPQFELEYRGNTNKLRIREYIGGSSTDVLRLTDNQNIEIPNGNLYVGGGIDGDRDVRSFWLGGNNSYYYPVYVNARGSRPATVKLFRGVHRDYRWHGAMNGVFRGYGYSWGGDGPWWEAIWKTRSMDAVAKIETAQYNDGYTIWLKGNRTYLYSSPGYDLDGLLDYSTSCLNLGGNDETVCPTNNDQIDPGKHYSTGLGLEGNLDMNGNQIVGIESWNDVNYQNGWTDYGSSYAPAGYYKDAEGRVHLRGLIQSGTLDTAAFTLPSGYRPANRKIFPAITHTNAGGSSEAACRIDIATDGSVRIDNGCDASWVSLEAISFRAG